MSQKTAEFNKEMLRRAFFEALIKEKAPEEIPRFLDLNTLPKSDLKVELSDDRCSDGCSVKNLEDILINLALFGKAL